MLDFLNRKISTLVGLLIILFFAVLAAWFMIHAYISFLETQFEPIRLELAK